MAYKLTPFFEKWITSFFSLSLFWFDRKVNTATNYLFDMNVFEEWYIFTYFRINICFTHDRLFAMVFNALAPYFYKPFAPENCCTWYYFVLAPQEASWIGSNGGAGIGEEEFYKPKSNNKESISCLYLLLVSFNINDDAFMQPCKSLFRHILTDTRIDNNKSKASVERCSRK